MIIIVFLFHYRGGNEYEHDNEYVECGEHVGPVDLVGPVIRCQCYQH